jgi:hypothetical protein
VDFTETLMPRRCWIALCSLLALCFCAPIARSAPTTQPDVAAAPAKSDDFLRLIDKGSTGSRLETADVAYRNADGVTVHLVAAVHVGEREYFEGLNNSFKLRDAVLYEMVKPRDVAMPVKGERLPSNSPVSQAQRIMKDTLGLEFQLDVVDYAAPNFIHADLDAETFQKMQDERGESFTQMFLQAIMKAMTQPPPQNAPGAADDMDKQLEDLVKMFTRPDMERQIRVRLARSLVDLENNPFGNMDGTVLVTERNKAAINVLKKSIADGKKDLAVFYGAAHMPDLSKRLVEMGFHPVATDWRMAWDLSIRVDAPSAVEKMLMEMIKGLGDDADNDNDNNNGNGN